MVNLCLAPLRGRESGWTGQSPSQQELILRTVDYGREISVEIEARAPQLMVTAGQGVRGAGTHFGFGGDVDRPGLATVAGEVNPAHVAINVASASPAGGGVQKKE